MALEVEIVMPVERIISPVFGKEVFEVPYLDREQAEERLQRARRATKSLAATSLAERQQICRGFLQAYEENLAENAEQITLMMGKPLHEARGEFLGGVRERTDYLISIAESSLAAITLPTLTQATGALIQRKIEREPLGVVLDIAAWNYPLLIVVNVVIPAILAGNAVLIKHAPQTALVGQQIAQAFAQAGAEEGWVQDFFVQHELLAEFFSAGAFDGVAFTGSTRGGREVAQAVGRGSLRAVQLELGGKDAAYVRHDADLEFAAENLSDAAFYNAGQSCCSVERIFIQEDRYDAFCSLFAEQMRKLRLGDPRASGTTLGPLVHQAAKQRAEAQVSEALGRGARDLVAPEAFEVPDLSDCYMAPRALLDPPQDTSIMQEESFAPIVALIRVQDDAEALQRMNQSRYGLTASIWSADEQATLELGRSLNVGTVYQNRADYLDPGLAWSGRNESGAGVSLSSLGFMQLTAPKSYHLRKLGPKS